MTYIFRIIQIFATIIIPSLTLWFYLYKCNTFSGLIVLLVVTIALVERAWETFHTSKEKEREKYSGDWTLAAVSFAYLSIFLISTFDFFFYHQTLIFLKGILGLVFLIASLRLRFWGMASLGKQWAVHAVGDQKIEKIRVIRIGPYKHIRHPIYLGIILEFIAFPLLLNSSIALAASFFIGIPLVVLRALAEEKTSLSRFGEQYLNYKREVGMLFPRFNK